MGHATLHVQVERAEGPVDGATVVLRDLLRGGISRGLSGRDGVARFPHVDVGLFRVEVRAIGFEPVLVDSVQAGLGERVVVRLILRPVEATRLPTVSVSSRDAREVSTDGPSLRLSRDMVRDVPVLNRDFTTLLALASQATGRTAQSIGGQHARFNSVVIDGGVANDLFGTGITPGSSVGARSLSLASIDELRISVAPFDVRHGGFTGGLLAGVTRSGTNDRATNVYSLYSRGSLTGRDSTGAREPAFEQQQLGLSSAGPIVRDRVHYFALVEVQQRRRPYDVAPISDPTTGISRTSADRVTALTRSQLGFDPGTADAVTLDQPNVNAFLKFSWQASPRHIVTTTHGVVAARSEALARTTRNLTNSDGFQLSRSGSTLSSRILTTSLKAVSTWSRLTHEGQLSASVVRDANDSQQRTPLFLVQGDVPGNYLAAGSVVSAQDLRTSYRSLEATSNTTVSLDRHLLTAGTQNLFAWTDDNFVRGAWGVWTYPSVEAFSRNTPSQYEVTLPLNGGPRARMSAAWLSVYAQDEWRLTNALMVTVGARYDYTGLNTPARNPALAANAALDRLDTSRFPATSAVFSPRASFVWTPQSARHPVIRGGVGTFVGRLPLVWLGNAFLGTGQQSSTLTCQGPGTVPPVTTDIRNLPSACLAQGTRSVPTVSVFEPEFRAQRATKVALGGDQVLGWGLTASVDLLWTRSSDNLAVTDANLVRQGTTAEGRAMYGSLATNGAPRIARRDPAIGPVYRFYNVSGENATAASATVSRRWGTSGIARVSHTWSRTQDVMSVVGNNGLLMLRNNPVDGSLEQRALRRSGRDVPHVLTALTTLPIGRSTRVTVLYRLQSGLPYAYTVNRDVNADGGTRNDLAYIPRDSTDITLSLPDSTPPGRTRSNLFRELDAFISGERCLAENRGRIAPRNSCRNPASRVLDLRLTRAVAIPRARKLELDVDLFNALNALNRRWGIVRETSAREDLPLLNVTGWDAQRNRPVYAVPTTRGGEALLPARNRAVLDASRWRLQLGARYAF
ncbi:MAG: TonB-dependent receptor [Gemmatimonadetes bacterium]|nr:TonB-dependent receptor [Gemmatimonadota bacterium]